MFRSSIIKDVGRFPLFLFLMWVVIVAVYNSVPWNYGLCMQLVLLLTWILWEVHVSYSTGSPGIDGMMPPRSCCPPPSGLWWRDPAAYGVLILRTSLCCCLVRTSPRDPVECLERGPDEPGDITYPTYSVVWFGPDH